MAVKKETSEILVRKLSFGCEEAKLQAVSEIRLLSKTDAENRVSLVQAGALSPLVELLPSSDSKTQENAITSLLNLSIHGDNRVAIVNVAGGLEAIVQVIREGLSTDAKANAAALLSSLVVEESLRPVLGSHTSLLSALLELLRIGSSKCKGDSLKALFYIAMSPCNKAKLVAAGAVPLLLALVACGKEKLTEGSLAVLAQIAGCPEGAASLLRVDTAIPDIISILNKGSPLAQENAASTLFNVCENGKEKAVQELLDDITCIPALRNLYFSDSVRGKSKAEALMKILDVRIPLSISSDSTNSVSMGSAFSMDSADRTITVKEPELEPKLLSRILKSPGLGKAGGLGFGRRLRSFSGCLL